MVLSWCEPGGVARKLFPVWRKSFGAYTQALHNISVVRERILSLSENSIVPLNHTSFPQEAALDCKHQQMSLHALYLHRDIALLKRIRSIYRWVIYRSWAGSRPQRKSPTEDLRRLTVLFWEFWFRHGAIENIQLMRGPLIKTWTTTAGQQRKPDKIRRQINTKKGERMGQGKIARDREKGSRR